MALFLAVVTTDGVLFAGRMWGIFAGVMVIATTGLVGVCWWKGEPARGRWWAEEVKNLRE
jgi:hypothetical protein